MKSGKSSKGLRGQAFDTMMLVISVIVAIAILGVLMNILGSVGGIGGVQDPASVMRTELKSIQSSGFGISTPKKVEFRKGVDVRPRAIIGDSPIEDDQVGFYCGTDSLCGSSDSAIVLEDNPMSMSVKKNTQANIVVCGDEQRTDAIRYCVGIGRQQEEAKDACTSHCID